MRICQICGHKDYPWKHRMYSLFTDYCHIEELSIWDKEVAEKLRQSPKFYTDGLFNYRLKPDGFVFRIWREDARTRFSVQEPRMEKASRPKKGNQLRLSE